MKFATSVKMKGVLVAVLLTTSVYNVASRKDTIDGHRGGLIWKSRILKHLAGDLGCAFNCTYRPKNVSHLPTCLATKYLGADIAKLSTCGVRSSELGCGRTKESAGIDAANCFWIGLTSSFNLGDGICVPRILADYKDDVVGVLLAFKPIWKECSIYEINGYCVHWIMECLGKSRSACVNPRCQFCGSIPPKNFPMTPEFTEVCLPNWIWVCSKSVQEPVDDLCPLSRRAAKLACYKKLQPACATLNPPATRLLATAAVIPLVTYTTTACPPCPTSTSVKTRNAGTAFIVYTLLMYTLV